MNKNYDDIFYEDENDEFMGTPSSKFLDIIKNASGDIVKEEIDNMLLQFVAMESMLSKGKDEKFDVELEVKKFIQENQENLEDSKKNLYMHLAGNIISKLDS